MSQDSVLRLLERSKKPLSVREISEKLNLTSAKTNVLKLRAHNDVKWVWLPIEVKSKDDRILNTRPVLHYFV